MGEINLSSSNKVATIADVNTLITNKEDVMQIVEVDNPTPTLPITMSTEINKYYRFKNDIDSLSITLPEISGIPANVKSVLMYFRCGSAPALTVSSEDSCVYFQDAFILVPGYTYEVNIVYNGFGWIIGSLKIIVPLVKLILRNGAVKELMGKGELTSAMINEYKSDIAEVYISNLCTSIADSAFDGCSYLTSVDIPNSVTSIGDNAFGHCSSLSEITIGAGVTSISTQAFAYTSITKIIVKPITAPTINYQTFRYIPENGVLITPEGATGYNTWLDTSNYYLGSYGWTPPIICKLTLSDNSEVTINGNGELTSSMIEPYKTTAVYAEICPYCTSVGNQAFENCSSLTSITIPDSVTLIGSSAFSGCSRLTSITIPDSVTSIGSSVFSGCSSLTSITIPDSVTSIGSSAFSGCSGLTSITSNRTTAPSITSLTFQNIKTGGKLYVPTNATGYNVWMSTGDYYLGKYNWTTESGYRIITYKSSSKLSQTTSSYSDGLHTNAFKDVNGNTISISSHTFSNGVGTIKFGSDVVNIGSSAFRGCSGLTSITIPDSVTSIGNNAFYNCYNMTSINIPKNITSIGYSAFYYCYNLTSITIPDSVTLIDQSTFYNCSGLISVTIGSGVTTIGSSAFSGCSRLTSITIPDSVTSIGTQAFSNCSSLESITIPDSVTSIGSSAFSGCSGLTSIRVNNYNTTYDSRNICNAIIETSTNKLIAGCKNTVIPDSVTSIGDYAFDSCSGLESINIPDSVTSIGNYAFRYCSGLTSITIPDSVTSIGNNAFYNCYNMTSVTIGSGVTSIGQSAFYTCSSLISIICYAPTAPTIQNQTFYQVKSNGKLYTPGIYGSGYDVWMGSGNYYLGKYYWTRYNSSPS